MKPAASAPPASAGASSGVDGSLLFLTGWPACGIAEFGAWLAEHRGFGHLDLDDESPRDPELREAWTRLLPGSARAMIRELRARGERWVVTGERPAAHLPCLGALREAGFGLWFLQPRMDGLSRQRWLAQEREHNPAAKSLPWDKLADAIRKSARDLRPHFRDHCVETVVDNELIEGEAFAKAIRLPALV